MGDVDGGLDGVFSCGDAADLSGVMWLARTARDRLPPRIARAGLYQAERRGLPFDVLALAVS